MLNHSFKNTFLTLNRKLKQDLCFERRADEDGRKEFRERGADRDRERERDREKERRQKEKERIRRQDEDRRRRRERQDGENSGRKRDEEVKKEKERAFEKKKGENVGDSGHSERPEKPTKDKKDDGGKRERLRNKVMTLNHHDVPRKHFSVFLRALFLCIRTGLPFSCTSQEPEAAIEVQEEEPNPTLPTGRPTLSPRKWPTKETTEQISTYGILSFGEESGDRPVRLRAATWRLRATCAAVQAGLHPALPVSEAEM